MISLIGGWLFSTPQFCKKMQVYDKPTTRKIKTFVDQIEAEHFFHEETNHRRGVKKIDQLYHVVTFDKDGKVVEEYVTDPFKNYAKFSVLKQASVVALECMAKALGWKSETRDMSLAIMQHQLRPKEKSEGIEFHRDDSLNTLVVLLENPKDRVSGWKGGEFLFKPDASKEKIERFEPEQGYGVLFSNKESAHAVIPFFPISSSSLVERTILTFHDYGPKPTFSLRDRLQKRLRDTCAVVAFIFMTIAIFILQASLQGIAFLQRFQNFQNKSR